MKFEWIRPMFSRCQDTLDKIKVNLEAYRVTRRAAIIELVHSQREAMNFEMTYLIEDAKRVDPSHVVLQSNEAIMVMNAQWCIIEEYHDVLSEYIRKEYSCCC